MKGQITDRIAVCKITEELLSENIITAQPHIDVNGADLLAILEVADGSKFARIQCKGRTLPGPQTGTNVELPREYVKGAFVCLVHVRCLYNKEDSLYCFFPHDILTRPDLWKKNDDLFRLNIYGTTFREKLELFDFNRGRKQSLKKMIKEAEMGKEFHDVFGKLNVIFPSILGHSQGDSEEPSR